jgi:hypothetical protein
MPNLDYQIVDRAGVLKGRVELNQRIRPESTLIKARGDKGFDALVSNSDEAADVGGVVADQPLAKFEYIHVVA